MITKLVFYTNSIKSRFVVMGITALDLRRASLSELYGEIVDAPRVLAWLFFFWFCVRLAKHTCSLGFPLNSGHIQDMLGSQSKDLGAIQRVWVDKARQNQKLGEKHAQNWRTPVFVPMFAYSYFVVLVYPFLRAGKISTTKFTLEKPLRSSARPPKMRMSKGSGSVPNHVL